MTLDFAAMAASALKVLVVGIVLGAGLPALYAFGIRMQSIGSGEVDGSGEGVRNKSYTVLAWTIFAVIVGVILFAILFIFIGAQFIGLGLLGEYIGRIYNDVRARPRYFIQQVVPEDAAQSSHKPD